MVRLRALPTLVAMGEGVVPAVVSALLSHPGTYRKEGWWEIQVLVDLAERASAATPALVALLNRGSSCTMAAGALEAIAAGDALILSTFLELRVE